MFKDVSARKVSLFSASVSLCAFAVGWIIDQILNWNIPLSEAVFLFLLSCGISTFLLTLISNHLGTYARWWKFARRYIPIAGVLMLFDGFFDDGGSGWMTFGPSGAEAMAIYTTFFYVFISIVIIIRARINS